MCGIIILVYGLEIGKLKQKLELNMKVVYNMKQKKERNWLKKLKSEKQLKNDFSKIDLK